MIISKLESFKDKVALPVLIQYNALFLKVQQSVLDFFFFYCMLSVLTDLKENISSG